MILTKSIESNMKLIAEGGEGKIYEYNSDIFKIFKPLVNLKQKEAKVKKLIGLNLPQCFVSPNDVILDVNNKFIGYKMKKVIGEEIRKLGNKKYVQINKINEEQIIQLMLKIKCGLEYLHQMNIIIGDLNDSGIIFDENLNVYFIDLDSYSVDKIKCEVIMDNFKDPLLIGNNFTRYTDYFAFAIIVFKSLTRIHPYGGTTNPEMNLIDRMKKNISVIENDKVVVPKNINRWEFMSPTILEDFKKIFNDQGRFLIDKNLEELSKELCLCNIHSGYYYKNFTSCPVCNKNAKILKISQSNLNKEMPIELIFQGKDLFIISSNSYIDINKNVTNIKTQKSISVNSYEKVYFTEDNRIIIKDFESSFNIDCESNISNIDKFYNTKIVVKENKVFYISQNQNLTMIMPKREGNYIKNICKTSTQCYYEAYDENNYFVINILDNLKIVNINGNNYNLNNNHKIVNYTIKFDERNKYWLCVYEDQFGNINSYVFDKNKVIFYSDKVNYSCNLSNIALNNGTIYIPRDGIIEGYNFIKSVKKEFYCEKVNEDSKLEFIKNKILVINNTEMYRLG